MVEVQNNQVDQMAEVQDVNSQGVTGYEPGVKQQASGSLSCCLFVLYF
jgi:hypothetical protein